jgi:hypothetical protein
MKWLFLSLLPLASNALANSCTSPVETRRGELRVTAIAKDGAPRQVSEFYLLDQQGRRIHKSLDGRFPDILYGTYGIEVSGHFSYARVPGLTIAQTYSSVRVIPEVGIDLCQPVDRSLHGQVLVDGSTAGLWIKAVSARGDYSREYELGPQGHFGFSAFPDGSLLLLVMRGDEVLATVTVRDFKQGVTISLPHAAKR